MLETKLVLNLSNFLGHQSVVPPLRLLKAFVLIEFIDPKFVRHVSLSGRVRRLFLNVMDRIPERESLRSPMGLSLSEDGYRFILLHCLLQFFHDSVFFVVSNPLCLFYRKLFFLNLLLYLSRGFLNEVEVP